MSLLVKGRPTGRDIVTVTPRSAGWRYVGFAAHRLEAGDPFDFSTAGNEVCVVVLRGVVTINAQRQGWREIGQRTSVFDDQAPTPSMCRPAKRSASMRTRMPKSAWPPRPDRRRVPRASSSRRR